MKSAAARPEAGDTLVEVLIAVVIIALTAASLLGALATTLTSSGEHRSLANIDTILRSYAEDAKYAIELSSTPWFSPCAAVVTSPQSLTTYNGHTIPAPAGVPSGWNPPYIVGIQYWNDTSGTYESQASCLAQPSPGDEQFLTLGISAPSGVSQTLTIGLRSPS
jgi:hypothetical protein